MFKSSQYPKIQAIYIFILAVTWSLYAYKKGIVMSLDSVRHSTWVEALIKHNIVVPFVETFFKNI